MRICHWRVLAAILAGVVFACPAAAAGSVESVHLSDFPVADPSAIDEPLADLMEQVRDLVSAGRSARAAAKLKVRQPLALAEIIVSRAEQAQRLR